MIRHPFLRCFFLMILLFLLLQTAVIAAYVVNPPLFYYRAWEYFFRWSNTTLAEDSIWEGEEFSDLGRRYFFLYQEKRHTRASTDSDGFRAVPGDMGPPRILVQGQSNVFGSGVSDHQTLPWQIAKQSGVATFNGAHHNLLSTLSRDNLAGVGLVIDVYHERHLANMQVTRRVYTLKGVELQAYKPIARQNLSAAAALYRPIMRQGYWIPDLIQRWWQRMMRDFKELRQTGRRPYLILNHQVDETPLADFVDFMEQRKRIVEELGYHYLAVIIPSRQSVYPEIKISRERRERGADIAHLLQDRDFPLVNLFPHFRAKGGGNLYFAYDTHWNPAGTRLAAELVVDEIRARFPELMQSQAPEQASQ